jgi:hypothetical protein
LQHVTPYNPHRLLYHLYFTFRSTLALLPSITPQQNPNFSRELPQTPPERE